MENSLSFDLGTSPRLRVLIADDNQETRRNSRLMLAMNPEVEVVAIARNGLQAVDLAEKQDPDLAIIDINMPNIDGLTAFSRMRENNPEIEGIFISAEKDNQTLREAMAVGAREYLIKPFTIDELNLAVHRVSQLVLDKRKVSASKMELIESGDSDLERLANEYAKTRRNDEQAMIVFETLAANPDCSLRWLRILAMIYVVREEWGKLRGLAVRLDHEGKEY